MRLTIQSCIICTLLTGRSNSIGVLASVVPYQQKKHLSVLLLERETRLVYRIIDGSTVCIRLILLTQNNHSFQRLHMDEFRSLKSLCLCYEKVCSLVRRTDCCFRKLFIGLICRSLLSCQNPQLALSLVLRPC